MKNEALNSSEGLSQVEIEIPKQTARALGRGLRQLLEEQIAQCKTSVGNFKEYQQHQQKNPSSATNMEGSLARLEYIIDNLEHAEVVKIVPHVGGSEFQFSKETDSETQPTQSEITINQTSTPTLNQLKHALQHNFNNAIFPLVGFSDIIQDSAKDYDTWIKSGLIKLESHLISNTLKPILNAETAIKVSTDNGKTTIEGISSFKLPSMS